MPGVGTLTYGNSAKPYQVTMLTPTGTAVPVREQSVTYTSYQRPNSITENGFNAAFTYNAAGDRVKMQVKQNNNVILSRYYIGKQYELDVENNIERLYLGGDAYSAPAVYVKENNVWKIYYICRDYLGSITHVANADGSLKQELSYDAWGRLRNPATHAAYAPGSEPILFLRRGYTGHEHLYWFGLVNMNARLYDPVLGRFLSPDPYVGNPFMTQNYKRYTYAMNNPLVYIDQDGELANWIIGAIIGVFFYAKAAHDNTPKEDQGNPLKWNWLPWNWGKPDEVVFHFGSNTDGSGMYGGISAGKAGQPQPMVGYSKDKGLGMGYHHNGNSNIYYPQYDYNKPEKGVENAIIQVRNEYNSKKSIKNWMKDHFYTSAQGEISYGVQIAGSLDKGVGINISPVHDILIEGNLSNKEAPNFYFEGEGSIRKLLDLGASYYAGVNYSQSIDLSSPQYPFKTHTIEVGAFGIFGATFNFYDDWSFRSGFFGLDLSGKIALGWGASGSLKLGFIY